MSLGIPDTDVFIIIISLVVFKLSFAVIWFFGSTVQLSQASKRTHSFAVVRFGRVGRPASCAPAYSAPSTGGAYLSYRQIWRLTLFSAMFRSCELMYFRVARVAVLITLVFYAFGASFIVVSTCKL